MYKDDRRLTTPPAEAALWRYMSFTKFVSLMIKNALFFARADKLGDPFEGSLFPLDIASRPETHKGKPEEEYGLIGPFIEDLRRFTLVNCWHESEYESDAMWKLYSGDEDGIAIKTDFSSLIESLIGDQPVHVGKVEYVDYSVSSVDEMETLLPFFRKRESFEHEKEVRALIMDGLPSGNVKNIIGQLPRYEVGTYHDVNISTLVKEVVVSPIPGKWFVELVQATAESFKLGAPVRRSSLTARPVWK